MQQLGRYRISGELGRGAMGVVYRALDPSIGREVAVKTIRLDEFTDARDRALQRERLFREARSAGILSHPGIVTVYDIGEQDGVAFIAMQCVHGPTLDSLLSAPEPLSPDRMFAVLRGAAEALDYAHRKGIVHRDIKPANIMVDENGEAKITDFGIAKVNTLDQLTHTGLIVGTPNYMAPEQVQGKPVSGRADQYSLCVIAYEMLTGDKPFNAEQITTLIYKIVCEEPEPPNRINPTLGARINAAILKGLAKNPEERYATCVGFVDALQEACRATAGWQSLRRGGAQSLPTLTSELAGPAAPGLKGSTTESVAPPAPRFEEPAQPASKAGPPPPIPPAAPAASPALPAAPLSPKTRSTSQPAATAGPAHANAPATLAPVLPPPVPRSAGISRGRGMFGYFLLAAACLGGFATGYLYFFRERPPDPDMARSASSPAPASSTALPVAKTPESAAPVRAAPESAHPERSASAPPPAASSTPPPEQAPPPPLSSTETATPPPGVPPQPAPAARREIPGPAPSAEPLTLVVASEPQGARAVLDGNSSSGCVTPCPMRITPGRHRVAFSLAGYRDTTREIVVKPETTRLPAYTLAPAVGVLMIQSQPDGAAILVNGRAQTQKTPAQMNLPPGRYQISVEKGGQRASQTVDLKDGDLRLITLALAP